MSLNIGLAMDLDTGGHEPFHAEIFDAEFTNNVTSMWNSAGVYDALYMSDGKTAGEVLPDLLSGLADMTENPGRYRAMDPPNEHGRYDKALPWLAGLAKAFSDHPKATIWVDK